VPPSDASATGDVKHIEPMLRHRIDIEGLTHGSSLQGPAAREAKQAFGKCSPNGCLEFAKLNPSDTRNANERFAVPGKKPLQPPPARQGESGCSRCNRKCKTSAMYQTFFELQAENSLGAKVYMHRARVISITERPVRPRGFILGDFI
jgi:hypothetical protein